MTLLHWPAPSAPAIDGEPKYLLFERFYTDCSTCPGWEESFRGMNYDDTPNGMRSQGRKHHSRGCPRHEPSSSYTEKGDTRG